MDTQDTKKSCSSSTLNVRKCTACITILFFYIVQLQKEMFLSREELQMSIRGVEDKEMEKQVFA